MIRGRRVLAVVPARGGSKGIPLKNLQPVGGVPLVSRVGQVVAELPEVDRAVVSTDHEEIAKVAEASGLAAPFRRPPELSGDRIGDQEVLEHALRTMESVDDTRYDVVLMLQPTSPLRTAEQVRQCLELLIEQGWDAVWTVSQTDLKYHPLKQLTVAGDGSLGFFDDRGSAIIARQQLTPVYHRNGVAYAISRACLLDQRTIKGERTGVVVLPGEHLSIDSPSDLARADEIVSSVSRGGPSSR